MGKRYVVLLLLFAILCQLNSSHANREPKKAPKLASYLVDKDLLSISGFSSGGYFAVQFHVAFSKTIMGAGIMAGGPYWCAQDDLQIALGPCVNEPDQIDVSKLVSNTVATSLTGTIDLPINMATDKVYLYSGMLDLVVDPGVMKKVGQYYTHFLLGNGASLVTEFSIPAQHGMVTDDFGNKCGVFGSPFINNCNYSAAYNLLQHIYGDVKPANSSMAKDENLLEFDQSEFFQNNSEVVGMDSTGFIYVPTACQSKTKVCRLHIAFHGCLQGRIYLSSEYALHAGYNGVAETNDIIILYPQAINLPDNPKGCWDWWGYTSPAYASKLGPQMAGVKLMLDRVVGF